MADAEVNFKPSLLEARWGSLIEIGLTPPLPYEAWVTLSNTEGPSDIDAVPETS